jgi:hypothetical protein
MDEQYLDFQIAAARHFGVDQSTISRRLAVLIEHEAVVVVRPTRRSSVTGLFSSVVIQPTEPPPDEDAFDAWKASQPSPHAKVHTDEVVDNRGSETACRNASEAAHSTPIPLDTTDIYLQTSTTGLQITLSDAKVHADEVIEKKASPPHAELHTVRADLGDRIVAAHQKLKEYESAAANSLKEVGDDCGWGQCAEDQRGKIAHLDAELKGAQL